MFRWFKLAKRVSELEDEMAKLARVVGERDLDWAEMRARCKRLLDRTEKAARRVDVVESEETTEEIPQQTTEGVNGHTLSLSPSQQRLQEQIMRSRRRT